MLILALDTASPYCSVSILDNRDVLAFKTLDEGLTHSESLLPLIDKLLKKADISVGQIDMFALSSCPGSFTGVRIGVSAVKGLAFGSGRPCVGVSTLEALAENAIDLDGIICPVMDARRNQFYNALFRSVNHNVLRLCDDRTISYEELDAELESLQEKVYLVGDGYALAHRILRYDKICITPDECIRENAISVGRVAFRKYNSSADKQAFSDFALMPGYLRQSQAEREANERKNKEGQ